jgi:hypothetical protein
MGKAPNEANELHPAPNEAIGKMGKAPNEASSLAPNEANSARAERSQFTRTVG